MQNNGATYKITGIVKCLFHICHGYKNTKY
jgi:hypothetical protein